MFYMLMEDSIAHILIVWMRENYQLKLFIAFDSFLKSYTKWTWHGELRDMPNVHMSQA